MSIDLREALHEAARDSVAPRPALAARPVLTRIRHRRAARAAGQGTVGVAAVGAVAVAGVAVTNDEESAFWPSAVALDGEIVCGQPMPALDGTGDPDDIRLTGAIDPVVAHGEPVHVRSSFVVGPQDALPPHQRLQIEVVVTDDTGVVVGGTFPATIVPGSDGDWAALDLSPGAALTATLEAPLLACGDAGDGGPLPAGEYQAYLTQTLTPTESSADEPLVLATGPQPLTVTVRDDADGSAGGAARTDERAVDSTTEDAGTETRAALPPLEDLEITPLGLAGLRLGDALEEPSPTGGITVWQEDRCDDGGRWVPAYPDRPDLDGVSRPPFDVWASSGVVTYVAVRTPGPRTVAGVQVGSTVDELRVAHPEATQLLFSGVPSDFPFEAWAIMSGDYQLVFEVARDVPEAGWDPQVAGRVLAIAAGPGGRTGGGGHSFAYGSDVCD